MAYPMGLPEQDLVKISLDSDSLEVRNKMQCNCSAVQCSAVQCISLHAFISVYSFSHTTINFYNTPRPRTSLGNICC